MTVPVKKSLPTQDAPTTDAVPAASVDLDKAVVNAHGGSPAKALQDRLDAHFTARHHPMSARFVTLLVMITCLGTWISGVGLYSTL